MINVTATMNNSNSEFNIETHLFNCEGGCGEFNKKSSKSNGDISYSMSCGSNSVNWDNKGRINAGSSNYRYGDRNIVIGILEDIKSKFGVNIPTI